MNREETERRAELLDRVANLAALGWPDSDIFTSEGIDEKAVPEEVREAIEHGRLRKRADIEIAAGILSSKAKVLQLDRDDPEQLPAENYRRQFRVLSLSPEVIGLPRANRDELARQIDGIVAPDAVKKRLRVDAGIDDLDIVKLMDNVVQEES